MLTADLVRARRKQGRLELIALKGAPRARALELAEHYLQAAEAAVGHSREQLEQAFDAVPVGVRDRRLAAGIRKLVEDRCSFDVASGPDPVELRQDLFARASKARRALGEGQRLERDAVVQQVAREWGLAADGLEKQLYADLRSAHELVAFEPVTAAGLVEQYELQQAQAVLLRAVHVTAHVQCRTPGVYRHLFRKLKFLRLLHTIERQPDGSHRIEIEGPYSLFHSTTKYGLQLAMVLPALRECDRWSVRAQVRWGKAREPLELRLDGGTERSSDDEPPPALLPDEVAALLERFRKRDTPWRAEPCTDVLSLPGIGVCVPDLTFRHVDSGAVVYLEALGFWSRDAVWRRVELAQQGLGAPIVFAVPRRLRVREDILDDELPAALYVYKGVLSAAAVQQRIERVAGGRL